ncbi:MAG TPA: FAD-binding oxidoreductase, partial [Steroidobacteraceae bacterium]|nr:FAD-binding oxidoreductase [Steroidobacteraceae bacterium]
MAALPYARTYYEDSAGARPAYAPLAGAVDCDVCVVGGGIAGSSSALHLAERGYRVVLLEDQRIGWGASGRSGAQVLPGVAAGHAKLRRLIGPEGARTVWDVSVEGVRLLRELVERLHIDCDFRVGAMTAAIRPRHDAELRAHLEELHSELGYADARFMPRSEVTSILDTGRYLSAVYDPHAGHIHPLNYTLGLAAAAARAGVRIFEHSRALYYQDGAVVRVRTAGGEVRARFLVLCGNVYLGSTAPALARKIMTAGTCIVATEPLGEARATQLITNNAAVCDMNWVLDYFRRSADHRLLFGGRVTYAGFNPDRIAAATRARMVQVYPQLQ